MMSATPPAVGAVQFGDLRRVRPLGQCYGFDRGQPIDRYYIERFLESHAADIRGRVLEIEDDRYTRRFGTGVTHSDVLHFNADHPGATLQGDLADAPHIASNSYDCVVLTQTLQYIYDVAAAVVTVARICAPCGVVLASVPGISRTSDAQWSETWMWNFTSRGVRRLFGGVFESDALNVRGHGNVLAATAFLHGLAVEDVDVKELDQYDEGYEICTTVRAQKKLAKS